MSPTRLALCLVPALLVATCCPAFAQSVISTHSGLVYFFDGVVYLGDQQLTQKFGRFPEIPQGGELRTAQGRAEVLLTPGVFLRLADNSSIRLAANNLSDTEVELLGGSAIVEATDASSPNAVQVIYKTWRVRLPQEGVYRLDAQPPLVTVYKGEARIAAEGASEPVAAREGEMLPLASTLVPEIAVPAGNDAFKSWAMSRSQAVASDNATAAGILDDPDAIDNATQGPLDPMDPMGSLASLSYFPLTGIPGIAVTNPYGVSFWSPYQSTLSAVYFPLSNYGYLYALGWPAPIRGPLGLERPFGSAGTWPAAGGMRLGGSLPIGSPYSPIRNPYSPLPIHSPYAPGPVRSPYSPSTGYHPRPLSPAMRTAPAAHIGGAHAGAGHR